jgi:hypothetical protein
VPPKYVLLNKVRALYGLYARDLIFDSRPNRGIHLYMRVRAQALVSVCLRLAKSGQARISR